MASRNVITFGFIPNEWTESQNEDQRVTVGDPEVSNTKEFNLELLNDDDGNCQLHGFGNARNIEGDEFWENDSLFYKAISEKIAADFGVKVPTESLQQLWALFQDELEDDAEDLVVVAEEDDGAEFINDDGDYNGCVYARHYFEDEDDEVSNERVVVVRC